MESREIIEKVKTTVKKACASENNVFKYMWETHLVRVVKYSKMLGEKMSADLEVLEIAALLHDYASILDIRNVEEHHIIGAKLAGEMLEKFDYPEDKIEAVKHCILTHRGSKNLERKTIEAKILANADAMAHFDAIPVLLWLEFCMKEKDVKEAVKYLKSKLERSWQKLTPEAREIVKQKYEAANLLLNF